MFVSFVNKATLTPSKAFELSPKSSPILEVNSVSDIELPLRINSSTSLDPLLNMTFISCISIYRVSIM